MRKPIRSLVSFFSLPGILGLAGPPGCALSAHPIGGDVWNQALGRTAISTPRSRTVQPAGE